MTKQSRKLTEIKGSKLRTLRQKGKPTLFPDGTTRVPAEWKTETMVLEFGSMKHPKNTDILRMEISVPEGENLGEFLGRVFKDLK